MRSTLASSVACCALATANRVEATAACCWYRSPIARVPAFVNASSCVSSCSCATRFSCCTRTCSCCVMRFRKSDATVNTTVCLVRPRS